MRSSVTPWRVAAVAVALACSSPTDKNTQIKPTRTIPVPLNTHSLIGYGDTMALEFTDVSNTGRTTGFRATLQLYRRDAASPAALLDQGTVYLGVDTLYHRLTDIALSADRATVTLNDNDFPSAWVAVVATDGTIPSAIATVSLPFTADRAVASGQWLLVAAGSALSLVDLGTSGFPVVKTFDMGTGATLLLAVSDGFLVFTNAGYGHVTLADATYSATASTTLRAFQKGYVVGDRAYVAGPSPFAGEARVAQIGLVVPATPTLDSSLDVEGAYEQFAYDGAGTCVLAFPSMPGFGPPTGPGVRAVVVRDSAGTLVVAADCRVTDLYFQAESSIHVRGGTLYALSAPGIGFYTLP